MAWVRLIAALAVIAVGFGAVKAARAHCDGLDGPVVKAAQSDYSRGPPQSSPILGTAYFLRRLRGRTGGCAANIYEI
jgi:hypothetical protein